MELGIIFIIGLIRRAVVIALRQVSVQLLDGFVTFDLPCDFSSCCDSLERLRRVDEMFICYAVTIVDKIISLDFLLAGASR